MNEKSPPSGECLKKDFVYGLKRISSDIRFSGGRSGARMRLYPDPLSALSVEKKGDDAVHRVSFFRSVTIKVLQIYAMTVSCGNL